LRNNSENKVFTEDTKVKEYFRFIQENPYNLREQNIMKSLFPDLTQKDCLEIGCAGAIYSRMMMQRNAQSIQSFDYSPYMINEAQKITRKKFIYSNKNINKPWNSTPEFDFICASFVLHYSENLELSIKNISKILKPNGQLLFSIPNPQLHYQKEIKKSLVQTQLNGEPTFFFNHSLSSIFETIKPYFKLEKCIINEEILILNLHN